MKRYLLILCATAGLYACSQPAAETTDKARFVRAELHNPSSRYVVVVSHRGDWRNWPENSIPAIESVIGMGVDIMELDLKLTKDSVTFTGFGAGHGLGISQWGAERLAGTGKSYADILHHYYTGVTLQTNSY